MPFGPDRDFSHHTIFRSRESLCTKVTRIENLREVSTTRRCKGLDSLKSMVIAADDFGEAAVFHVDDAGRSHSKTFDSSKVAAVKTELSNVATHQTFLTC